ncbi:MAG: tyrosine-type recombinase/integrase [Firmicutes bacterium]|nr:tyrosine-type recombinase/integrase [Bacillota bacterium]
MNAELLEYIHYMAVKGYSKRTIYWHQCYLEKFFAYLQRLQLPDLKAVTNRDIDSFKVYLKEEYRTPKGVPITAATYFNYLNAINGFFRWLEDTGQILIAPVVKQREAKQPKQVKLPNVLNETEVLQVLDSCPVNTGKELRDRAILELLYSTGIRRSELVNLNVADFSPERQEVAIFKGKGRKDRVVPLGEYASRFIEAYLKMVRPWMVRDSNETALFVSNTTGKRLHFQNVGRIIQRIVKQCGITKPVSLHTFRHSMATHLLRNGADLRHIQAILGHANLSSTEIYTHLTKEDLKQALKKCHPHGSKGKTDENREILQG